MSNEQRVFDFDDITYTIASEGGVSLHVHGRYQSSEDFTLTPDEFRQLAEAQRNVAWAGQHWTSLARVNDALASLLAVEAEVYVVHVARHTWRDEEGRMMSWYVVRLANDRGMTGSLVMRDVETTGELQQYWNDLLASRVSGGTNEGEGR